MTLKRRAFLQQVTAGALAAPGKLMVPSGVSGSGRSGEAQRDFFYRPTVGHVGDVIPFYTEGRFRVFHLHRLDDRRPETVWCQASTNDFVHFTDHGEMLSLGTPTEQDLSVATGSVIQQQGRYHAFYTGFNSVLHKQGKPEQGVMHAVSDDLLHWKKIPADTFFAPQDKYERDDWRDPFVFWNDDAREYWMLVAARLKNGPSRRRGCTALCVSQDLTSWEVREPFWAPGLYFTHECPDLFRLGDWWYFLFSEFSEQMLTRYRMSRTLTGPWQAPENDSFDGRALYAAKTASDGHKRFLFGWNPTRTGEKDEAPWEWGGNLVVHQLVQERDGTLSVKVPETVDRVFSTPLALQPQPGFGKCETRGKTVHLMAPESFACARIARMPERCKMEATIEFTRSTRGCGLMLRTSEDLNASYYLRLEPAHNRIVFDRWPRPGDAPFVTGLERPVALAAGVPVTVKVVVDGTIGEVYVAGRVALSTRMYNLRQGDWGVFVEEGNAQFRGLGFASV